MAHRFRDIEPQGLTLCYDTAVGKKYQVGPALRILRQTRRISQVEAAERIGIHRSGVSRYESPQTNLTVDNLLLYLESIGASLTELDEEMKKTGAGTGSPDALAFEIARHLRNLEDSGGSRDRLRQPWAEAGHDPEKGPPEVQALGKYLESVEDRLRKLEEKDAEV